MSHDVLLKGPEQVNDRPVRLTRFDDEAGNEIAVSDRTTLRGLSQFLTSNTVTCRKQLGILKMSD